LVGLCAATVQVLVIVYQFCAWNITIVEMNSGIYLLKSYIRQVPLFTSGSVGNFYPHVVSTMVKTPVKTGLGKTPKTHKLGKTEQN